MYQVGADHLANCLVPIDRHLQGQNPEKPCMYKLSFSINNYKKMKRGKINNG
jgi:hypothetical protein